MPRTIKLIAVRGRRVLLVYKASTKQWSLPGGKAAKREKSVRCLRRELKEEIPRLRLKRPRRWRRFNLLSRSVRFTITCYFAEVSGPLFTDHEIDAAAWVRHWERLPLSANTRHMLERLAHDGYLQR